MEPRQQWRGNHGWGACLLPTIPRFNGAAPTMARKHRGARAVWGTIASFNGAAPTMARKRVNGVIDIFSAQCASMEPRQQWRGNPRWCDRPDIRIRASMEPRQQWRGNRTFPTRSAKTAECFNGAAPTMARKPDLPRQGMSVQSSGFNGAAPTMARKQIRNRCPDLFFARFNGAAPTMARKLRWIRGY